MGNLMRTTIVMMILVPPLILTGCVSEVFDAYAERLAAQYAEEHGSIEDYGALCDFERLGVPYAPDEPDQELLTLDVYYNEHEGLQPMVVNIHGGAWFAGDKDMSHQVFRSKYLANHGYVVFNVNYRLAPKYPIQTQIEDVMGAVIWAKEHAPEFGGDPTRVGVTGGSAGGHLAAMVAWASDDPFFVPTGHADSQYDSDVLVAAPYYGVYDLEETLPDMQLGPLIAMALGMPCLETILPRMRLGFHFFTGMREGLELDALIRHISPKYHVTADSVPTLFLCGDADDLYPQSVAFERLLHEVGVEAALCTAPGGPHGFDAPYADDVAQEAATDMVEWFDRFLSREGIPGT
ncbi:MAG: Lipase 2 [Candidatus Hydrogenedentes bacterium ADurb.Bin101]|nr:MAG: Lipase 2 [Candidatus Hydrogenedentes bacterium ADurb.Bin101]HPB32908.1 alpha/beta hydrolase [Candidatus Sumerlaeota bacterium]